MSTPPAASAATSSGRARKFKVLVNHLAALGKRPFEVDEKNICFPRDLSDLLEAAADGLVRRLSLLDLFVHVLLIVAAQSDIAGNDQRDVTQRDVALCAGQRRQGNGNAQKCRAAPGHA